MLVSFKWLEDYVSLPVTPEELAEKITRSGIEVDGIHRKGQDFDHLVAGRVLKCERHPNADKLTVCLVDIGEGEPVQIVCGAKKRRPGTGGDRRQAGGEIAQSGKNQKSQIPRRGIERHDLLLAGARIRRQGRAERIR